MSASRAEGSRLAPLNAINQHFHFDFGQFLDFHGFSKTPPLSKIRKIQAMDEITIVNNIFAENRKFTESQAEIKRRKAAVDCFNCCERMRRMPQLLKYASVDHPRHISEAYFQHGRTANSMGGREGLSSLIPPRTDHSKTFKAKCLKQLKQHAEIFSLIGRANVDERTRMRIGLEFQENCYSVQN